MNEIHIFRRGGETFSEIKGYSRDDVCEKMASEIECWGLQEKDIRVVFHDDTTTYHFAPIMRQFNVTSLPMHVELWCEDETDYPTFLAMLRSFCCPVRTPRHFYPEGYKVLRMANEGTKEVSLFALHSGVTRFEVWARRTNIWNMPKGEIDSSEVNIGLKVPSLSESKPLLWITCIGKDDFQSVVGRYTFSDPQVKVNGQGPTGNRGGTVRGVFTLRSVARIDLSPTGSRFTIDSVYE